MIEKYVEEIEESYKYLREKYQDKGEALTLLQLAVNARNADHMNANIQGSMIVKSSEEVK